MHLFLFLIVIVLIIALTAGIAIFQVARSLLGGVGSFLKMLFFGEAEVTDGDRAKSFSRNSDDGVYESDRPFRTESAEGKRRMRVFKSMSEPVAYEEKK